MTASHENKGISNAEITNRLADFQRCFEQVYKKTKTNLDAEEMWLLYQASGFNKLTKESDLIDRITFLHLFLSVADSKVAKDKKAHLPENYEELLNLARKFFALPFDKDYSIPIQRRLQVMNLARDFKYFLLTNIRKHGICEILIEPINKCFVFDLKTIIVENHAIAKTETITALSNALKDFLLLSQLMEDKLYDLKDKNTDEHVMLQIENGFKEIKQYANQIRDILNSSKTLEDKLKNIYELRAKLNNYENVRKNINYAINADEEATVFNEIEQMMQNPNQTLLQGGENEYKRIEAEAKKRDLLLSQSILADSKEVKETKTGKQKLELSSQKLLDDFVSLKANFKQKSQIYQNQKGVFNELTAQLNRLIANLKTLLKLDKQPTSQSSPSLFGKPREAEEKKEEKRHRRNSQPK